MQTLGGCDHELWSNGHLPGIDPAGPQAYPTVNHADALPPTRYMGNEDSPHVAMVSVHFISLHAPFVNSVSTRKGLGQHQPDADHSTLGIIQYIPSDPAGPPPPEGYAPAIPVRVVTPTLLPSLCIYNLSYCASNCRGCPTTTPQVTYLFLTM